MIVEVSAGVEMERFIFLDRLDRNFEEIRSADYVSLEFNIVWLPVLDSIVDFRAGYSDFFLSLRMDDIPGTYKGMHRAHYFVRDFRTPDQINIAEFISAMNYAWRHFLLLTFLDRVRRLSHAKWVHMGLHLWDAALAHVHLT